MPEILFYAVSAFVGRVETLEVVHFWCDDIQRLAQDPPLPISAPDPNKLVKIDFANKLTPATWATAEIDAPYLDGGLTGIGPDFPGGRYQGAAYCNKAKWDECMAKGSWKVPQGDDVYQYQCLARSAADGSIERFHGFRAAVVRASGRVVLLDIYTADDPTTPQKRVWIDLDDGARCLPNGVYTTIDPTSVTPQAIFLSGQAIVDLGLLIPKLPPGYGSGQWPQVV